MESTYNNNNKKAGYRRNNPLALLPLLIPSQIAASSAAGIARSCFDHGTSINAAQTAEPFLKVVVSWRGVLCVTLPTRLNRQRALFRHLPSYPAFRKHHTHFTMVRAPVSLVLALTLLFAALSSATTPTLATAAKLAARRAALLRELELVEIDLKAVSLDIDVNSSTCSLDTCDEEKGIVNQDEEDRQEKKEMEVAEDVEKSLPVATANLTLADIMKENIFLRSRERKAKLDASLPPWYEDHQGGKTHGLLHLFYATPVYRTNINLVKGEGTSQVSVFK